MPKQKDDKADKRLSKKSLTGYERHLLYDFFCSQNGGVLDFSVEFLSNFFRKFDINIDGSRYHKHGESKAKRLRAFFELEGDQLIADVTLRLIDHYICYCEKRDVEADMKKVVEVKEIINNLIERPSQPQSAGMDGPLDVKLREGAIEELPIEKAMIPIVIARLKEAEIARDNGAYRAVVFLCGSVLEGVLLGATSQFPDSFKGANAAPKTKSGALKKFPHWTLAQLIAVASEIGMVSPDVTKWSDALRNFRNYIHPHQEMMSEFSPDKRTAQMCLTTLASAFNTISKFEQSRI